MKLKLCYQCQKKKIISEFYTSKYSYDGRQTMCNKCEKSYRKNHRKEIAKRKHEWYIKHKKSLAKAAKIRYLTPEFKKRRKISDQKYNSSGTGIYTHVKSNAKRRNINFNFNRIDFINWYKKQEKICVYCRRNEKETFKDMNVNTNRLTVDRKDNKFGYKLNNIVLCCPICNTAKGKHFTFEEMLKIGKTIKSIYYERK